jgi:peptidoglycan hydrolase-like protein with peptidoglycan-binding domain
MSGMIVAGGLAFRAGVAPGAHRDRRAGSSRFSSRQPSRRVDDTSSTGRVRLAARADATATEAKRTDSKEQEPKKSDAAKASKKETSASAKDAKKKDTSAPTDAKRKDSDKSSASAEKASAAEPPAPPAAPAGYEKEIKRLQKAGVETHDFGVSYLDDGKNSEHVKELQRFLKGTGHYNYKDGPTGYFGPLTAEAVRKWQRKYGLPESGGWGAQSRATYLQVKHSELRAMRDPEAAASWAKSAMANGLVSKATGLPVPPSIGDGRAGEARPSWVASAGTGTSGTAGASGGNLMDRLPGIGGPASYVAAAMLAVGMVFGVGAVTSRGKKKTRRFDSESDLDSSSNALPGFGDPASDAREDTIEDVQVWHKDGDDDERK